MTVDEARKSATACSSRFFSNGLNMAGLRSTLSSTWTSSSDVASDANRSASDASRCAASQLSAAGSSPGAVPIAAASLSQPWQQLAAVPACLGLCRRTVSQRRLPPVQPSSSADHLTVAPHRRTRAATQAAKQPEPGAQSEGLKASRHDHECICMRLRLKH